MTKINSTSMFSMDQVNAIMSLPVADARAKALEIVDASGANARNKVRAQQALTGARSVVQIGTTMTNFMLAHPSNGLKVIN